MSSLDNSNHCWSSQLKALYGKLQNKALVRSSGPMSFFNAMLHWLLNNNLWALILLWMALPFWWYLCTKFFSAKGTLSHSYVNTGTHTRSRLQSYSKTFSLSSLPLYSSSVFTSPSGWQNEFLPIAALVLQYVSNQANWQRLLLGLRLEDLPALRYWGVMLLKLPMFLKSSEQILGTNKQKKNVTTRV